MAIEAPISKFKKTNIKICIAVCIGLVIWCVYDAHFNEEFIKEYTDADGNPAGWLVINRMAPPFLIGAAVLFGLYLFSLKDKKLLAEENELVINDKKRISYDSIQQINKTYFEKKGFFVITYKNKGESEARLRLSDRKYDNLQAILEHLVAKIS
jgi:hypothetical protein